MDAPSRGGPMHDLGDPNMRPLGADAWWIEAPITGGELERTRILRHGRGGPSAGDFAPPGPAPAPAPPSRRLKAP